MNSIFQRFAAIVVATALSISMAGVSSASAAAPRARAGITCTTANAKARVSTAHLKCLKNARGKLVWTKVTAAGKAIINRASVAEPSVSSATQVVASPAADTSQRGPSGFAIVADPNNGGSSEVVYPDPAVFEQRNSNLAPGVTGLELRNLTENSVDVVFTPTPGVSLFQAYIRYNDSFTAKGADASNAVVHFDDLSPGWDYVACVYYLQPLESEKVCANIHTLGATPNWQNYLPGPTGVVATAVDDTIEVHWAELADAQRYSVSIEHNTSFQAGGYTEIGGARNHIRFNSGSVSPGLTYNVRVSALLSSGDWTVETVTQVRSNGSQPPPTTRLAAPTNLRVTDVTPTSVTVAWDVPSESTDVTVWSVVARYQTSFTAMGAYPSDRSFTIPNLNPGLGYQIIVSGYNSNTGIWTSESMVSVLLPTS
ncbi:MAG: fibronectin type III domain-containing protein [Actinomycetales bacterium]|nr:fibronectin type III domain-containing protein [Actinomycetales bacterium]